MKIRSTGLIGNPLPPLTRSQVRTNAEWLHELSGAGGEQTQALQELRGYLIRAALIYLERRRDHPARLDHDELLQLAQDLAQEALLDILDKLDNFQGRSRFTTWAYRFVINAASEEMRRRRWRNRSLDATRPGDLPPLTELLSDETAPDPEQTLLRQHVWETLRRIIAEDLTHRQRSALLGFTIHDAPVEELARELKTNPNNLYKILHDARKKLKRRLLEEGITAEYVWRLFGAGT